MDYFRIGMVLRPHGVKGEVKIMAMTDDIQRFKDMKSAFVENDDGSYQPVKIEGTRILASGSVMVKIAGYENMSEAEDLRHKFICVDRDHAIKLPEGTYFISDMIGCKVESTDGTQLGEMVDIYTTSANDVYVVMGDKKLSVPALKRLLTKVDIENKRIVFDAAVLAEVGLFED